MAQDPGQPTDHIVEAQSPRATPRGDPNSSFRLKYGNFIQRVKLSAQKAKAEAKRKRTEQRILRGYKHNARIMENMQNKRNFSISTETLHNTATSNIDAETKMEQKGDNEGCAINMDDDWTAIVIHKKPKSKSAITVPRSAPPPIPHERREEIEESLSSHSRKRRSSVSLQNLFKRRKSGNDINVNAKEKEEEIGNEELSDSMSFNLDSVSPQIQMSTAKEYEMVIQWEWCDDNGVWHKYGKATSKSMEESYIAEEECFEYDPGIGRVYIIKFQEMKQYNNLNEAWDVRRNEIQREKLTLSLL